MQFWLFTQKNPQFPQLIHYRDTTSLVQSNFDVNKETRIVIHGWLGNLFTGSSIFPAKALVKYGNFNVIAIDWSAVAVNFDYFKVA